MSRQENYVLEQEPKNYEDMSEADRKLIEMGASIKGTTPEELFAEFRRDIDYAKSLMSQTLDEIGKPEDVKTPMRKVLDELCTPGFGLALTKVSGGSIPPEMTLVQAIAALVIVAYRNHETSQKLIDSALPVGV